MQAGQLGLRASWLAHEIACSQALGPTTHLAHCLVQGTYEALLTGCCRGPRALAEFRHADGPQADLEIATMAAAKKDEQLAELQATVKQLQVGSCHVLHYIRINGWPHS